MSEFDSVDLFDQLRRSLDETESLLETHKLRLVELEKRLAELDRFLLEKEPDQPIIFNVGYRQNPRQQEKLIKDSPLSWYKKILKALLLR